LLDGHFGGTDNLIMKMNGKQVLPSSGNYHDINGGQKIHTNIQVPFTGQARLALIEYDWGSDNDDLGHLDIQGGMTYQIDRAIIKAPRAEDGSIYFVSYKVEAGQGDPHILVDWVWCGTNQCDACTRAKCEGQGYSNLDRDKDYGDLKSCPPGYSQFDFKRFPQHWPVADVFLRRCKRS